MENKKEKGPKLLLPYQINYNKNGEIISYRIWCNGINPITKKKDKNYAETWKVPKGLTDAQLKKELTKEMTRFMEQTEAEGNGTAPTRKKITLVEYSKKWLQDKINLNEIKRSYIVRCKEVIEFFEDMFKDLQLCNFSPDHTVAMIDKLKAKEIQQKKAILKKDIKKEIQARFGTLLNFCQKADISETTFLVARKGENIDYISAEKICSTLGVPLTSLFRITNCESKHYSKASIKKYTGVLSAILASAKAERKIVENYAKAEYIPMKFPKKESRVKKDWVYDVDECKKFIKYMKEDKELNLMQKTLFLTELYLGLRKGEALALRWDNIDFDKKEVTIESSILYNKYDGIYKETPKNGEPRVLSAPNILLEQLRAYKEEWNEIADFVKGNFLFVNKEGLLVHPCSPHNWLNDFYDRHTDIKRLSQHKFRHTNVTLQLLAGNPVNVVSEFIGHAQPTTTHNHYTHFVKSGNRMAANAIDNIMAF